MSDFTAAQKFIDDCSDLDCPGQKGGVTQVTFSNWLHEHHFRDRPVSTMTELEMLAIFRETWERWNCDRLVQPWAMVVLDAAINLRPGMTARIVNGVLRFRELRKGDEADWDIDKETIRVANATPELAPLVIYSRLGYHVARTRPNMMGVIINRLQRLEGEVTC